jgi:hypothetical protein
MIENLKVICIESYDDSEAPEYAKYGITQLPIVGNIYTVVSSKMDKDVDDKDLLVSWFLIKELANKSETWFLGSSFRTIEAHRDNQIKDILDISK